MSRPMVSVGGRIGSVMTSRTGRLARGGDLVAERLQRLGVDPREARERLDRVGENLERYAGTDRQRRLLEPFACFGSERVCASQALAVAGQREEPVRLSVRMRVRGRFRGFGQ